jgi:3'-phosphoadenosine 5'-phosphosulfate sulfotransferase (PAPS reductase)/FAD synthetase
MKKLNVVSFSGGKDSTAMLLRMIEEEMPIDLILHCDVGMEFPTMYEHIEKVEKYIGREITYLKAKRTFEFLLLDYELQKGKRKGEYGYGWARPNARWCTNLLKTQLIDKTLTTYRKEYEIIDFVGIAADEPKRIKDNNYPLVEWNMTEKDCLDYCYVRGFNWEGLYEYFKRVSCWCCPLQSLDDLRKLRKYYPELWKKLKTLDEKSCNDFRINCSVKQLEERFTNEDAQINLF